VSQKKERKNIKSKLHGQPAAKQHEGLGQKQNHEKLHEKKCAEKKRERRKKRNMRRSI